VGLAVGRGVEKQAARQGVILACDGERRGQQRGYRDGLKAALHGIQRSLDHFDDMQISRAREDNGDN
jgi:hypothetical protein